MKTSSLISRIYRAFPSTTRLDIKDEINIALDILIDRPLAMMRVKDSSTGLDPVLTTTDGVFEYTINATSIGEDVKWVERAYTGEESDIADYDNIIFTSRQLGDSDITITFAEDPGGNDVKLTAYKGPTTILSESYPVNIPLPNEFVIKYLFELVAGNLESLYHGKSVRRDAFYANDLARFHGESNKSMKDDVQFPNERYY